MVFWCFLCSDYDTGPRRVSAKRIRSLAAIVCICGCLSLTIQLCSRDRKRDRDSKMKSERGREREGKGREKDIYVPNTCAHIHVRCIVWCTVEREYKRLKAKRKQTGSSLSKPNSGRVKLRHVAVGSPSERGNFLSFVFPIIFPHYFFNAPLNTRCRKLAVVLGGWKKKEREKEGERDASFFFVDSGRIFSA